MKLKQFGQTNIKLSEIGLGCWQFSKNKGVGGKYWPKLTDLSTKEIVESAIKSGVNWFDTAELYGWGKSEEALASALKTLSLEKNSYFIATKWWPLFRKSYSIKKTINERLKYLKGLPITLHQIHMPYGLSSIESEMDIMAQLVKEGKVRHVGVSNFNKQQMIRAYNALQKHGIHLSSNQVEYNILNRKIESNGILNTAKKLNISIIAYSPLAQGFVSGKFHEDPKLINKLHFIRRAKLKLRKVDLYNSKPIIDKLCDIAIKYNATTSQIALKWLMSFHDNVFTIPGSINKQQCQDNTGAMKIKLTNDEIEQLDLVSRKYL